MPIWAYLANHDEHGDGDDGDNGNDYDDDEAALSIKHKWLNLSRVWYSEHYNMEVGSSSSSSSSSG